MLSDSHPPEIPKGAVDENLEDTKEASAKVRTEAIGDALRRAHSAKAVKHKSEGRCETPVPAQRCPTASQSPKRSKSWLRGLWPGSLSSACVSDGRPLRVVASTQSLFVAEEKKTEDDLSKYYGTLKEEFGCAKEVRRAILPPKYTRAKQKVKWLIGDCHPIHGQNGKWGTCAAVLPMRGSQRVAVKDTDAVISLRLVIQPFAATCEKPFRVAKLNVRYCDLVAVSRKLEKERSCHRLLYASGRVPVSENAAKALTAVGSGAVVIKESQLRKAAKAFTRVDAASINSLSAALSREQVAGRYQRGQFCGHFMRPALCQLPVRSRSISSILGCQSHTEEFADDSGAAIHKKKRKSEGSILHSLAFGKPIDGAAMDGWFKLTRRFVQHLFCCPLLVLRKWFFETLLRHSDSELQQCFIENIQATARKWIRDVNTAIDKMAAQTYTVDTFLEQVLNARAKKKKRVSYRLAMRRPSSVSLVSAPTASASASASASPAPRTVPVTVDTDCGHLSAVSCSKRKVGTRKVAVFSGAFLLKYPTKAAAGFVSHWALLFVADSANGDMLRTDYVVDSSERSQKVSFAKLSMRGKCGGVAERVAAWYWRNGKRDATKHTYAQCTDRLKVIRYFDLSSRKQLGAWQLQTGGRVVDCFLDFAANGVTVASVAQLAYEWLRKSAEYRVASRNCQHYCEFLLTCIYHESVKIRLQKATDSIKATFPIIGPAF